MRIVVFSPEGQGPRVGALVGKQVIDLHVADPRIPGDLLSVIQGGQKTLDFMRTVVDGVSRLRDDAVLQLADVRLRAPWPGKRIAMIGGNFGLHLYQAQKGLPGMESLTVESCTRDLRRAGPWGFWKTLDWVTGPDDALVYPKYTELLDYEGEVALVISAQTKNFKAADMSKHIWGVTLLNDWSDRSDTAVLRPLSFNLKKNFDGSVTIGPCIVVDEIDPENIDVETKVNGEVRQSFNTKEMIFSYGEAIEEISRGLSFAPGDIVGGGTGAGTAVDTVGIAHKWDAASARWFLKPGDVVEISSPQIGAFRNQVVAHTEERL